MPKQPSSQNLLMDLRLVILRTISDVWADDNYTGSATGWDRLLELGIINERQYTLLEDSRSLTFNQTLRITLAGEKRNDDHNAEEGFDAKQLKKYFKIVFDYRMPLPHFGTYFIPGTAEWNTLGFEEWGKPVGEIITVFLPKSTKGENQNQRTIDLMKYYSYFPTFFGPLKEKKKRKSKHAEPRMDYEEETDEVNLAGNDFDLGVSQDSFFGFGAVVNQLIAKAWDDPFFMKEVDFWNPENRKDPETYYASMLLVLETVFQFTLPWAFDIQFIFVDDFWEKMEKHKISNLTSLEMPINPKESSKNHNYSMALAKYNTIGPAYPFTCS